MYYNFDTQSLKHAQAALILYALYRSRNSNSPLNGVETWDRFATFVRGASLKGTTTPQFIQAFCQKAKIDSIKPKYLQTDEPVLNPATGELIRSDAFKNYQLRVMDDNSLLPLFANDSIYLCLLVRERIQREKFEGVTDDEAEDQI